MLIVTVCTANLCRSPLAERLLAARLGVVDASVEVSSTGVEAIAGMVPPPDWVAVAAELGVELATHRSRAPRGVIERADLILTMTAAHTRTVALTWPESLDRVVTLREAAARAANLSVSDPVASLVGVRRAIDVLHAAPTFDVADPVGRPHRVQTAVARQVLDLVDQFVAGWSRARPRSVK